MANRITESDLRSIAALLNTLTKSPDVPYTNGKANVGNYHISHAYGGVSLHRMVNTSGGCSDVLSCGHVTKRDLYNRMRAFIAGIEQ